jgi:WD40-like Beta Propeller Repeat
VTRTSARVVVFAAICLLCAAIAVGYVTISSRDEVRTLTVDDAGTTRALTVSGVTADPHLLFRDTGGGDGYGKVAVSTSSAPGGPRALAELRCDRVHVSAGVGMCLRAELGVIPKYEAMVFDESFTVRHRFDLAGQPSRTQVSPDGTLAAYTVFVTGHSYAEGGFSTRTAIVEMATGTEVVELEQFTVWRDGRLFDEEDFNFWGVTFTDDANRFYATLGTGDEFFLVEGDVAAREMRVLAGDVECPSLSPDGTRVAYKERNVDAFGLVSWRLAVLDLRSMTRWQLGETRDVDDQVEWLDDRTVMYGLDDPGSFSPQTDVWTVPADGSGEPALLVEAGWSAVMVR